MSVSILVTGRASIISSSWIRSCSQVSPRIPETVGPVLLSQVQRAGLTGRDGAIFVSARREPGNSRKQTPCTSQPSLTSFKGSPTVWQINVILMDVSVCSTNKAEPCVPNFFLPSFLLPIIFRLFFFLLLLLGLVVETELNQTNSRGVQIPG